jgi:hypothetical protein
VGVGGVSVAFNKKSLYLKITDNVILSKTETKNVDDE